MSLPPDNPPPIRRPVAVALRNDRGDASLPRVVASGHGAVAEQILELAFAHGVKVRTDADLAEILAAVDVESEIPIEAIAAVAEILAHVYRANGAWTEGADGVGPDNAGDVKHSDRSIPP